MTTDIEKIPTVINNDEEIDLVTNQMSNIAINNDTKTGGSNKKKRSNNVINNGTGAGGANTNKEGKLFEDITNNQEILINDGYIKNNFTKIIHKSGYDYLSKKFEDKTIIFVTQYGLKKYMKNIYNIEIFRCPDEAYIIEYNSGKKVIKILEKKKQTNEGSVETKLWAAQSLKREYELVLGNDFEVHYALCLSDYFKSKLLSNKKKYIILKIIFNENNIVVLFGDEENYFELINNWINNSL
jgi:hypothetical protein